MTFDTHDNPLASESPAVWDELISAVSPASILVVIGSRMSDAMRRHFSVEDVFQEALLHAWRDRRRCEWRGLKAFRSWLLSIIDHRIHDMARHEGTKRRGGVDIHSDDLEEAVRARQSPQSTFAGPIASTTPSRLAVYHEQADTMRMALEALAPDYRDVVRLRLFNQLTMEEIAAQLGIGLSAARHRFRKGSEDYRRRLVAALSSKAGQWE